MSARGSAIGSIALGVLIGVIGIAFPPASVGFFYYASVVLAAGTLIAGGAFGLAFQPKAVNRDTAKGQDLQIATAAEGVPIPVPFGTVRMIGNFGNYERQHFRSVKVTGRSDGSKGGDQQPAQIIGYDFYLHYEYHLCMGPVDEIDQVLSSPGETRMMGTNPTPVGFGGSDYVEINLDSVDVSSNGGAETGLIRLYRGTGTQQRIVPNDVYNYNAEKKLGPLKAGYTYKIGQRTTVNFTSFGAANNNVGTVFVCTNTSGNILDSDDWVYEYTGLNYRNVCWAEFIDFRLGRFPQPKSYHFILRRMPRHDSGYTVTKKNGTTITGFRSRGSEDNTKPAFKDANPAAILYEVLTDDVWGRGLPDDLFGDFSSWISVSQYFNSRHIGMSLTLDTPDRLSQILDAIRFQLKTVLTWDGEFLKLRCLLDLATTHGKIQTLTKADFGDSLKVTVPLWHATTNELRVEFNNRARNYRPDAAHAMDIGNHQITGRSNVERINLQSLTDFNIARRQAFRILREKAYPTRAFQWTINRFHSQIEIGDVVKIWQDEIEQDSTIYVLVTKIEESSSDEDEIRVSGIEDRTLIPATGFQSTPTPPTVHPWEKIPDIAQSDLQLWTGTVPTPAGTPPMMVMEMPAILSRKLYGTSALGVMIAAGQRPAPYFQWLSLSFKRPSQSTYTFAGNVTFSIGGELLTDITVDDYWDRSDAGFEFELSNPDQDEAEILSMFTSCDLLTDDLIAVANDAGPYMIVKNEMIQIGKVEKISTNRYRARNFIRRRHSSLPRPIHPAGTLVFFVAAVNVAYDTGRVVHLRSSPGGIARPTVDDIFDWKMQAHAPGITNFDLDFPVRLFHDGTTIHQTNNEYYRRESDCPLAPTLYDITDNGTSWTIRVRPMFREQGAGVAPFYTAINQLSTSLLSFTYKVVVFDDFDPTTRFKELTTVVSGATLGQSVTITLDPGKNPTGPNEFPDSGLVTITPIPKTFVVNEFVGGGTTSRVKIYALDNANALTSVEDLDLKSQLP